VTAARFAAFVMLATATLLDAACSEETAIPPGLGPCIIADGSTCATGHPLSTGGTSSCGSLSSPDVACEACLTASCCSALSACSNDASCITLDECESSCAAGDDVCAQNCANANPSGVDDLEGVLNCESSACNAPCSGTTSDAGAACGYSSSNATCETCLETDCCTQAMTCSASSDCASIVTCVAACATNDTACQSSCVSGDPAGSSAYDSFNQCLSGSCTSACANP
jgi:hypothetical protein